MTLVTETTPPIGAPNPQPTLETIVRLVEQTIVEQQETRMRLDSQSKIMRLRFDSFQKQLDAAEDRSRAEFLTLTNDIANVRKHVGVIEDHVGFLTQRVADHDKRFDHVDARLADHDKRFDHVDARLDTLTEVTLQIRDAVLPPNIEPPKIEQ